MGCLFIGSVDIPSHDVWNSLFSGEVGKESWRFIVSESRLPAAITALLSGGALALAGLILQTTFDNPLAGPSILGISTGAGLGVAIIILAVGGLATIWGQTAIILAAIAGAMAVLIVLLLLSSLVKSQVMLLITGILVGYLSSSAITLLNFFAGSENVHSYMVWGLGSFNNMTWDFLPEYAVLLVILMAICFLYIKPMNACLLGPVYAESVGINIKRSRNGLIVISGVLTAVVTAGCGPIGFIGLVVPHIARLTVGSTNHIKLMPVTIITGCGVGTLCQLLSVLPGTMGIIPINAITPAIGVPIIIYIIVKRRKISYFN